MIVRAGGRARCEGVPTAHNDEALRRDADDLVMLDGLVLLAAGHVLVRAVRERPVRPVLVHVVRLALVEVVQGDLGLGAHLEVAEHVEARIVQFRAMSLLGVGTRVRARARVRAEGEG